VKRIERPLFCLEAPDEHGAEGVPVGPELLHVEAGLVSGQEVPQRLDDAMHVAGEEVGRLQHAGVLARLGGAGQARVEPLILQRNMSLERLAQRGERREYSFLLPKLQGYAHLPDQPHQFLMLLLQRVDQQGCSLPRLSFQLFLIHGVVE
jgi:hypothetical protein